MPLGTEVPRPRRRCVRWGPRSPAQKGAKPPKFSVHVYCGQTAGWIKMPLGTEVGLGPDDIMLDGDPALPPQKGASFPKRGRPTRKRGGAPQFSAHVYCSQTAAWIKMPLGTEVGLVPGDTVLYGDPAPLPKKGTARLNFRPIFVAKRLDASRCHFAWR